MRKPLLNPFYTLATTLLGILVVLTPSVAAYSENDLKAIIGQTPNFSLEKLCDRSGSTGSGPLTGSDQAEQIWNYFTQQKGLTPPQAAGIMGNIQAESGLNSRRVQGAGVIESDVMAIDGVTGYGLAQWTSSGRQQGLHDAATKAGVQDSDLAVQLDYLWYELNLPDYKTALDAIKGTDDVAVATSAFMLDFEKPADQSAEAQAGRAALSTPILAKYGSGYTPSTGSGTAPSNMTTTSSCGPNDSASPNGVVGNFSLPVDKKWYDEHKEWFTKPHHDYPAADIPVPTGTPVYAITEGTITRAPSEGGYGEGIEMLTKDGYTINYGHGSDGGSVPGAHQGDKVGPGQLIMHSASTGDSSGPHLHLDIKKDGNKYCPQSLFTGIVEGNVPALASLPTSGCIGE